MNPFPLTSSTLGLFDFSQRTLEETVASHTDTSKFPSNAMAPYAAVFARASAYKYLDLDLFDLT